ncbi:MAG TPA: hypothetical protein DCW74_18390 [Alteromonas australica]|uniref:Uncharacterized protein n=1 Tax=Alteromonas australica TaxID=589873 RepID=A0A350P8S3_9ALTE|nr:hypothetical protein [Alteromonas australica]
MTFSQGPIERNNPPCPTHGAYAAPIKHQHNFRGIVEAVEDIIFTVSGLGTTSYSRCADGYEYNFKGIVQVLEDLNTSISGIIAGSGGDGTNTIIVGPSGVVNPSSGNLWFDTNQGRLFVWASDNWYQTNAEAIALFSDTPPSPSGLQAPPRDGSLWYNTNTGSLFVYEESTAGWYEASSTKLIQFGPEEPVGLVVGEPWADTANNVLKIWNGTTWAAI